MATVDELSTQINQLAETMDRSLRAEASARYEALITQLQQLDSQTRELFQARLDEHFWPVVAKLENGTPLAAAEQDMLQLFMVGDAKYYVKYDNELERWKREVTNLVEAMRRLQAGGLTDLDSLLNLRVLYHEAMRILPDLAFYYREKERVQKFEQAIQGAIDRDTRRTLANLIKDMLASDKL